MLGGAGFQVSFPSSKESVEQDGAFSFGEGEECGSEGFVVVDAVEGGVVVSAGVCEGDAVFEGLHVEGCRLVRVAGGDDLPDLGRFYADLVGEFGCGGFAAEVLCERGLRFLEGEVVFLQ